MTGRATRRHCFSLWHIIFGKATGEIRRGGVRLLGDTAQSVDVTNLSEPLEYALNEFENGKIRIRLQINGVENTVSEIYIQ